jgi:hypothetical protein
MLQLIYLFVPFLFLSLTSQITGGKKQSEAPLFAVRVHLHC